MQNIVWYLNSVLDTYWGNSRYELLLYLATIIILLLEKKTCKRALFGWYGILCFIGLFNPVTARITFEIWGESVAYYCRQISLIPIFMMIAYGIVLLLSIIKKECKIIIVIFITLFVCVNGNMIYSENWYTKADDFNKIPESVIEIARFLKGQGESIRVGAPTSISAYLREYMNIIQIQGRYADDVFLEQELQTEYPDVDDIMQYAGDIACDYIVVKGADKVSDIYRQNGYIESFKTDNFLVYKVEGVKRWRHIYDKENRMVEKIFLDEENNMSYSDEGYSFVKYSYDLEGNVLTEHYYDEKGEKTSLYTGEYGVVYKYDEEGNKAQISYLGRNDETIMLTSGYAIIQYTYDDKGNKIRDHYFDTNGKPISLDLGQYGALYKYDSENRLVEMKFLDKSDEIFETNMGYATIKYIYDFNGNKLDEKYYDSSGNEVKINE